MLTAMGEPEDRIDGLEAGVDDYLGKPFEPRELLLRLHSILRRLPTGETAPDVDVTLGSCRFETARGELTRRGKRVHLTEIEAALLSALASRPGQAMSREELIDMTGAGGGGRAVDVQVTRLRRKIEDDPRMPRYLQTVRGKGYVLHPD